MPERPIREGLFTADDQGRTRLVGGACASCGRVHFPPAAHCPWCGGRATTERLLSPEGTVWGWTEVTSAPPGYEGPVPYHLGVVELPEGLRVVTRLVVGPTDTLRFGLPVRTTTEVVADDGDTAVVTWAFTPSGAGR
jgi:uncharacterized OB-fold protein